MKWTVVIMMLLSQGLYADTYRFELTRKATDLDEAGKIKGQSVFVITSTVELTRRQVPASSAANDGNALSSDSTIQLDFEVKSFDFKHEKTGDTFFFEPETLEIFDSLSQLIAERKEMLSLSEDGSITHSVNGLKLEARGWQDYGKRVKQLTKDNENGWADSYVAFELIRRMPVCFAIDSAVAIGDVIDLPLADVPTGSTFTSNDFLTSQLIVTGIEPTRLTLESHHTKPLGLSRSKNDVILKLDENESYLLENIQMDYDMAKQRPVKVMYDRFVKIRAMPEHTQVQSSQLVIEDESAFVVQKSLSK